MGAKRKVDEKLYMKIKKDAKSPSDDKEVMMKYDVGQTTVRAIRNSNTYTQFLVKTSGKKLKIENRKFKINPRIKRMSTQERTMMAWYGFIILSCIMMLVGLFCIIRWILSWFGV